MKRNSLYHLLLTLLFLGVGFVINHVWFVDKESNQQSQILGLESVPAVAPQTNTPQANEVLVTVGNAWTEFEATSSSVDDKAQSSLKFDRERIRSALRNIALDRNGTVIANHAALQSLNAAFAHGQRLFTAEELQDFIAIVKSSLPTQVSEQVATIIENFHDYLRARQSLFASVAPGDELLMMEELQGLQAMYLGDGVAADLFRVENANGNYMLEAIALEQDTSLSAEQKKAQQQALQIRYAGDQFEVDQWEARYYAFQSEKAVIEAAGYPKEEVQQQIQALVDYNFKPDEQARLSHLNLW
ncbi:MAG: hypothetical protein D9N13_22850 [Ketobacter sp. GenoA1]|nr:MAG: hypothetical protein D9N13_22850 [Ketobacter sp. GenoA1]RLT93382.1 MAG: hypothetical protein D9N15_20255 [Ketobacter sp.]